MGRSHQLPDTKTPEPGSRDTPGTDTQITQTNSRHLHNESVTDEPTSPRRLAILLRRFQRLQ